MGIDEYEKRVLALFQTGGANPGQWDELAVLVLHASESDGELTEQIDASILGPSVPCPRCETVYYPSERLCPCGAAAGNRKDGT